MNKRSTIIVGINNMCVGGAQRQLARMLSEVDHKEFDVHVITLFSCNISLDIAGELPAAATVHHVSFTGFLDVKAWLKLRSLLVRLKPQVVMSSLFFSNTVFRVLKLFVGYVVITREHNTYFNKARKEIFLDRVLRYLSTYVVSVSEEVAALTVVQQKLKPEQSVVIHNGIDMQQIADRFPIHGNLAVRKKYNIPVEDTMLLFVGRLVKQKRCDLLIEAFAQLSKEKDEYVLCLIGDGSQDNNLKNLVKKYCLSRKVFFLGSLSDPHPLYNAADVFVSVSRFEGMSNTHLEALAHGLPIVSTKTGGTAAIIEHQKNGYLLEDSLNKTFGEAIAWYEEKSLLLCTATIEEKKRLFTIKKAASEYQKLWRKVL